MKEKIIFWFDCFTYDFFYAHYDFFDKHYKFFKKIGFLE